MMMCFFFFQAEDGIRDRDVTGVQTYALPISLCVRRHDTCRLRLLGVRLLRAKQGGEGDLAGNVGPVRRGLRSEERRVGKGGSARWSPAVQKQKKVGMMRDGDMTAAL